jgi:hypothetical protein
VFHPGEEIELKVQALLRGAGDSPELSLCIRSDYFLKNIETLKVTLNRDAAFKSADDRSLYTGTVKYSPKQYGSFNTVVMLDNKPVFSAGGDFAALHELDKSISPLRRQLGGHFRVIGSTYQLTPSNDWAVVIRQGIDLETQLYAQCGFGHAMVSFDLKKVQSDPDKLDFSIPDAEFGVLNKYGIEMIPSLGAWWIYTGRRNNGGVQISPMPGWFFDDKYTRRSLDKDAPDREPRTLKDEVWKRHVDGAVKHFGSRIDKWMLLVEPQWVLKPEDYLILQKIAWEAVKQQNPKSLLIAGDATSDVGNNLMGWIEKMHSLGFEKYLDCVSFNPYESSLDNIGGVLFRYSDLIAKLRKTVVPGTQLWEQELYFIANSKRKQHPGQQDVFSAGDVQRHYLLGLLNGLRGITAIPSTSISKNRDELGPNDILAGLNSLSFFLDEKVAVLPQKLSNKLLHCGIFADKTGENCSGVIWSFRPGGMTMKVPAVDGVKLYDCYGNELRGAGGIELAADPVFATGSKAALAQLFSKAEFITPDPVKLYARTFGGMTFLEAENLSGSRSITMVDFDGQIAPVQFYFKDSDYQRIMLKGKLEQPGFKSGLKGESGLQSGSIAVSVNSGEFTIPAGEDSALKLQMNDGSKLALWTGNGKLWIKAEVSDPAVTPAADNNLYTGDALEMFVDRAPFNRIGRNEFGGMNISELDVRQYIFAAVPSATGRSIQIINASSGREFESGATLKQEKTAAGYTLLASLPLAEIAPSADGGGIVGMNFELSKKDGGGAGSKAMLIPSKFPSYKYRSHYPLFQINALNNADMLRGAKWKSSLDGMLKKVSAYEVKESFAAESGVKVEILEEPSWGPGVRRGSVSAQGINLPAGNYLLDFYAKGDKISEMKVALSKARKEFKGGDLPVNDRWTRYEIPFTLTEADAKGFVYIEFHAPRKDPGCTAVISGMRLYKFNN